MKHLPKDKTGKTGKTGKWVYLLALALCIGALQACGGGGDAPAVSPSGGTPSGTGDLLPGASVSSSAIFHVSNADQLYTTAKPIAVAQLQAALALVPPALPVFVDGRNAGSKNGFMGGQKGGLMAGLMAG
ncbi:MAG: hypothetical protein ORN28_04040, partial [Rhodoferax sp.]|nr:hypothetical protein [Rhodoferax sp.]